MLKSNPAGLDLAYTLPADWLERVLAYRPTGVFKPLVQALQAFTKKQGPAAIAIEHVQELALMVCGVSDEPRFCDYKQVFELLKSAAGSTWPVKIPLEEQLLASKPVFDAAQRMVTCDGEWLVLRAMVKTGWIPIEGIGRCGRDWTISKEGRELPVEVKTKQGEGSDLGRLRFALRGLSMIPEGEFLQRFAWHWTGGIDLTRKAIAEYYELLRTSLTEIDCLFCNPPPMYEIRKITCSSSAVLSLQRCGDLKFTLRFEFTDKTATKEDRSKNQLCLIAKPNPHPQYLVIDAMDAHLHRQPDNRMLDEVEAFVFDRLRISAQASKRPPDTLVVVVWEVPFYWKLDLRAVENHWREWCARSGVQNGILIPVQMFAESAILLTDTARTLFSEGLDFFG